jgi:hypothetical protein
MTPEERAAKVYDRLEGYTHQNKIRLIADAIRTAVAEEREACAKVAETLPFSCSQMDDNRSADIAAAIRVRSQEVTP